MNEFLGEGWEGGLNITIIRLHVWINYKLSRVKFKIITCVEGHSAPNWLSFVLNINNFFFSKCRIIILFVVVYCNWQWNTSHQQEVTAAVPSFTLCILNTNKDAERCVYKNGKQSEAVTLKHNVGRFLEPTIYDHWENSIILIITITKITYPCGM